MSDAECRWFFDSEVGPQYTGLREIVEKDPLTLAVSSTVGGQDPRWYDQCLRLAGQGDCCLCGKHPCGDTATKALISFEPSVGEMIWGICAECKASTVGQSKERVLYRAWYAQFEKKIRPEHRGVMHGNFVVGKEGLP